LSLIYQQYIVTKPQEKFISLDNSPITTGVNPLARTGTRQLSKGAHGFYKSASL